jgi:sRNA-binding regulator protein Hfq
MSVVQRFYENGYIGCLVEDEIDCIIYLHGGHSFAGTLVWADKDTVYLREKEHDSGQVKLIYKRGISAIEPSAP